MRRPPEGVEPGVLGEVTLFSSVSWCVLLGEVGIATPERVEEDFVGEERPSNIFLLIL